MAPFRFGNSSLPEIVKFTEFGREHFALPIGARSLEHHDGANEEPMLSLVIVAPVLDPSDPQHERTLNLAGTSRENDLVRIIHDVAHDSHEFTADQLHAIQKAGVTISQVYPGGKIVGGRWSELTSGELEGLLGKAQGREKAIADAVAASTPATTEATAPVSTPEPTVQ